MTEGKTELEKALKLSRRLRKEIAGLTEWLALTDIELTRRSAVEEMPEDLDAELAWSLVGILVWVQNGPRSIFQVVTVNI